MIQMCKLLCTYSRVRSQHKVFLRAMKRGRFKKYMTIWAICSLPLIVCSYILDPDKLINGHYSFIPSCLFKFITDDECIGCGFTRSMSLFAHGRLEESLNYNKMGYVIFMLILILNLIFAVQYLKKKLFRKEVDSVQDT